MINDEKYQILSNGTLNILRTELDDQGDYVCIGKNDIGETQTTVKLNVKGNLPLMWDLPIYRMLDFNLNEPPIILQVSQATREAISCLVQNANPKDTVWRDDKEQIISSGESLIIQQVSLLALRQEVVTPTFCRMAITPAQSKINTDRQS